MEFEAIKSLAVRMGMTEVPELLEKRLNLLSKDRIHISVTGGINGGKTTLINALAGTSIEVSSLPSDKSFFVTSDEPTSTDSVKSDNIWMKKNGINIVELQTNLIGKNFQLIDYGLYFAGTDICIFLLNSTSALSRTEFKILDALRELEIPTLIVLSMADQLGPDDYAQVYNYVCKKIKVYENVQLIDFGACLRVSESVSLLQKKIDSILTDATPVINARKAFSTLFEIDALSSLYERCNERLEETDDVENRVNKNTCDKKTKLSDLSTVWLKLQAELTQRRLDTSSKVSTIFASRKEENIRQLSHNTDICNDVKLFWEKELPFRLEDIIKMNSQAATQIINTDIINTVNWLNSEIKKSLNRSLNSIQPVSYKVEPGSISPIDDPHIADNRKMRIATRIGTAATVIAAGTMCATMGIGGVVVAASMLSGIGADYFIGKKQNESREKVKSLIPQIVEMAHQQVVSSVSDNLSKAYDDILCNLHSYQKEWLEEREEEIEKEHNIAMFNVKTERQNWEQFIQDINQISKRIQNF